MLASWYVFCPWKKIYSTDYAMSTETMLLAFTLTENDTSWDFSLLHSPPPLFFFLVFHWVENDISYSLFLNEAKWTFLLKSLHCFYLAMLSGPFGCSVLASPPPKDSCPWREEVSPWETRWVVCSPLSATVSALACRECLTASTFPPQEPPGVTGWPGLIKPQELGREIRGRKGAAQMGGHLWIQASSAWLPFSPIPSSLCSQSIPCAPCEGCALPYPTCVPA